MTSSEITPYEKLLENLLESISVILFQFCISILLNGSVKTNISQYEASVRKCWDESVMANRLFFITRKTFEAMEISPLSYTEFLQNEILVPIWSSTEPLSTETLTEMLKKLKANCN